MQYKSAIFGNRNYSLIVIIPKRGVHSHMKREKYFVGKLKGTGCIQGISQNFPDPLRTRKLILRPIKTNNQNLN